VSAEDAAALAAKLKKPDFSLEDFLEQLRQMKKLGPMENVLKMLPGVSSAAIEQAKPDLDKMRSYEAILTSMTPRERRSPRILDGSRRRRIAAGSGTTVPEVNRLLKDFERTRMLMKHLKKGPRGLAALRGRLG
jgi:signal recognition particle subunit SRP54